MIQAPPIAIAAQIDDARRVIERHLGTRLAAIHLFGSAVAGGLQPHSDIDLLATVTEPPDTATLHALALELLTVSAPPGQSPSLRALEVTVMTLQHTVPWRHPARRELQFGEWLREDLLAGIVEPPMQDHDLAIVLTKVLGHSIPVVGPPADQILYAVPRQDLTRALLDTVAQWNHPEDWADEERNIILALARIWYTAVTGEIASKSDAATWLLERIDPPHRPILSKAHAIYLGRATDDLAERHARETAAFIAYARRAVERTCAAG
ncbi:aminoglycoside adenylyltransferase family protein [Achromobacter mucicolens]|uniref:Aminoglycoside (3'') (9) adenylyltransferase n=1 Tax=Achromobacter mucicolens TaxID=1389922 RepID=A0ABD4YMH6_9BURK|nr:aminoglycoside adenylyltransferase family protein [Achromobacter mucicolens]MDH1176647.1 aminoglycoside adenylyltransferase family protein [Achromobacter mucicolens]